ncbi:SRPBCC family protein [Micromonospora sp. BRA006-A]|nr:SRPBCC family protein [Micromonospora sp. BRA006-A]
MIGAPPEEVWRCLTDVARYPVLLTKVDTTELLHSQAFGTGTSWRETRRPYGWPVTVELRVTDCRPPFRYVVECFAGGHGVTEYRLVPGAADGTTDLQLTYTLTGGSLLHRISRVIARRRFVTCVRENNVQDLLDIERACGANA